MFHKAGGKLFFFVVTIMFFALSVQNTWAFLNRTLPDASPVFLFSMMIIFEGGFLGWLAMLMHGAENVYRVGISFLMLLITGAGVFVGAYFEIGGMMHAGIGYTVDPAVVQWVPISVLLAYMATGAACVLYMLASPEFFHRMNHMNQTGQAPAQFQMFPTGQPFNFSIAPGRDTEPLALPAPQQPTPAALPAPASVPVASYAPAKPNRVMRAAGAIGDFLNGARKAAPVVASNSSQPSVNVTPEPSQSVQQPAQSTTQPAAQSTTQPAAQSTTPAATGAKLDFVEQTMLDQFANADQSTKQAIFDYADSHTPAEMTAFLQQKFPGYEHFFTEKRVTNVMAALRATQPQFAAPSPADHSAATEQNNAAPRPASARRKPTGTSTGKGKGRSSASASNQRRGSMQTILPLLDQANPGLSDADLAKLAGCSPSTVNRWRASLVKPQQPVNEPVNA